MKIFVFACFCFDLFFMNRRQRQRNFPPQFCCFVSRPICLCVCCSPAQSRSHYKEIPVEDDIEAFSPTARRSLERFERACISGGRVGDFKTQPMKWKAICDGDGGIPKRSERYIFFFWHSDYKAEMIDNNIPYVLTLFSSFFLFF